MEIIEEAKDLILKIQNKRKVHCMSIVIFCDGSGHLQDSDDKEIFGFNSSKQMLSKLKKEAND